MMFLPSRPYSRAWTRALLKRSTASGYSRGRSVTLVGADRVGCDGHAFDHAMRVALEDAAVHERAGVAFVPVTEDVLHVAGAFRVKDHLSPVRKPARRDRADPIFSSRR